MKKAYKWEMTCDVHGTVHNYSENDITAPGCPTNSTDQINGVKRIISSLEKDTIITEARVGKTSDKMKLRGTSFLAAKNTSTVHIYDIDEDLYIKDGALLVEKNVAGDSVDIDLCDQADNFLYSYVKGYPVSLKKDTGFEDQTLSDTNFNGLRFKITYHSTGTTDNVCVGLQLNGSV